MSEQPFMQFYVGDYLADTTDLTTEEHGAYLLLLMTMWRHEANLPNDPRKLARICRLSPAKFKRIWAEISRFFDVDGDTVSQKRLTKEFKKAKEKSQLRATAGAKGGKAKALKNNEPGLAKATDLLPGLPKHSSEPESDSKSSVSKDTGAAAPPDPKKIAFDSGVKLLGDAGTSPKQSRSIIGKWIKAHGEGDVISALGKAQREGAIDPVAFCEGVFRHQNRNAAPEGKTNNGYFGHIPERN